MKIIDGYNDFKLTVEMAESIGKFRAWETYYLKYTAAFDPLFRCLYKMDEKQIPAIINQLDFKELLLQSEKGRAQFPLEQVKVILKKCCTYFDFKEAFSVYIMTGLNYSDGAAPPAAKPFIFLGLELIKEKNPEILISHEFSHMVRFYQLKDIENVNDLTVKQLMVAEGLAVWTSLELSGMGKNDESIADGLMMSRNHYRSLQLSISKIKEEIFKDIDCILDNQMIEKYFTGTESEGRKGYFLGAEIIKSLREDGMSLKELTFMGTEQIMEAYNSPGKGQHMKE